MNFTPYSIPVRFVKEPIVRNGIKSFGEIKWNDMFVFFGQGYMSDHIIVISVEFHKIFTYKKHMVVTAETISWSLITGKISMFITVDGSLVKKRSRILVPLIGEVTSWCNPWSCTMSIRWLRVDTYMTCIHK